ncbi:F-box protein [Tripterygium wilfordii]|uniref:F-box protein n=1 Tax=Tripterygium wilfordii TaxID=458696 RepID=A0A7J7DEW4_TRIWF|nr:F-box protein At2g27310-like [Tripterygium wilfordii]KAF5744897.1 F-box protein [Tripterygium wilfordii]
MDSSCSSATNFDQGGGTTISTVHPDIIQTHILTRLDGPTLASAACVSSQLHALSTQDKLWRHICSSTWPSVDDPRVSNLISAFPAGHRSFYNDSFTILDHNQQLLKRNPESLVPTSKLVSAVDIFYKEKLIFSRVQEMETVSGWFLCSPFRVDLLDPKETVSTPVTKVGENEAWLKHMEDNLKLSWIVIDPTRRRAANISTGKPVFVQRHWLTGEVQVRFGSIMVGEGRRGSETEFVDCGVVVTWGGKEGGELHVSEVSMVVEDMEGRNLNGRDSLVILQDALDAGKRRKVRSGKEGKERYEEYVERKRERNGGKQRRERALDMACIATGVTVFLSFWTFILFR